MRALRPGLLWPQPTHTGRPPQMPAVQGHPAGPHRDGVGTPVRSRRGEPGRTRSGQRHLGPAADDPDRAARRLEAGAAAARGPRRGGAAVPAARRWSTSSRTTCCRGWCRSTPRCSPSSAARPAPASPRWSTPSSGSGSASRACCAPRPARPVLVHHPDDVELVPARARAARPRAHHPGDRPTRAPSSWSPPPRSRRAWPCSTPPTSTRSRSATAAWPPSCSAAADLWLFVTSAARYADQVPWDFLKQAAERSAAVAIVLDRTAPEAVDEVSSHLARMLTERGLKDSPLFTVAEAPLDDRGLLPAGSVADIRGWLTELGEDVEARNGVVRQTLDGAVRSIVAPDLRPSPTPARRRPTCWPRLKRDVDASYEQALADIDKGSADGTLLRGRGARPLAGVRRHRRAAAQPGVQGRLAARPGHQRAQGQAAAGRAGHRRGRVGPADAADRARRGGRRARRRVLAVGLRRAPGARGGRYATSPRASRDFREPLRADGARLAVGRARPGPQRGQPTSARPRGSCPSASTGSRSR